MNKCGGCKKFVARADIIKCTKCTKCATVYHPYCVKEGQQDPATWVCPSCASKHPAPTLTAEVPAADRMSCQEPEVVAPDDQLNSTANDTTEEFKVELGLEIRLFRQELTAAREEIKVFRSEVQELKNSFLATDQRLNALDSRVDQLEQRLTDGTGSRLESIIAELRLELNEKDQEMLENDVEVSNLPEESGENPMHLILSVANKLGVSLRESDVVSAERVGARNRWSRAPGEGGEGAGAGGGPAEATSGATYAPRAQGRPDDRGAHPSRSHFGRPRPVLRAAPHLHQRTVDKKQSVLISASTGGRAKPVLEIHLDQKRPYIRAKVPGLAPSMDTHRG
ncbi:unnamed protein product [Plutella xylostella]|uniref:(diamondback moth) hypothetical protein n=1 Tax=Plutella xylostella TaxID=51655 RepID=A0A8S4GDZ9_PLUXY|nr:unnamed protein product [Plutella xylostella]